MLSSHPQPGHMLASHPHKSIMRFGVLEVPLLLVKENIQSLILRHILSQPLSPKQPIAVVELILVQAIRLKVLGAYFHEVLVVLFLIGSAQHKVQFLNLHILRDLDGFLHVIFHLQSQK